MVCGFAGVSAQEKAKDGLMEALRIGA